MRQSRHHAPIAKWFRVTLSRRRPKRGKTSHSRLPRRPVPTSTGYWHESQHHSRDDRQHASRPHQPALRRHCTEGVEVWLKLERANPGGSIKDRIGIAMIEDAERRGVIKKGR